MATGTAGAVLGIDNGRGVRSSFSPQPKFDLTNAMELFMLWRSVVLKVMCCALITSSSSEGVFADEAARKSGIDRHNFNMSVRPGDDFYEYVNGTWIKENPIPAEYGRWGAFPKLRDDNLITLHEILESLGKEGSLRNDEERKLRDFYRTAMDER